jgi:GNAT superfamily N-acetyltransferase
MIKLEQISSDFAESLCRLITSKLPEYFGLSEVNEHYAIGVRERINIAAEVDNQYVGLISIEFPYANNANIYWMAVLPEYHNQGIGRKLIEAACELAKDKQAKTITVETLSPKNADENYLKTYNLYLNQDFKPLFDLKPNNYEWKMVYMAKNLEEFHKTTENEDLTIRLLSVADIKIIVEAFQKANWPKPASIFEEYLKEQENDERLVWVAYFKDEFVGYITLKFQSKYPPFSEKNIPEINDFNVLPKYRNKGIGLKLLKAAETIAATRSNIVGIGVGLYADYGAAQRMYVKQGYLPDGLGITYDYKSVEPGKEVKLDDDLILWFTKKIK